MMKTDEVKDKWGKAVDYVMSSGDLKNIFLLEERIIMDLIYACTDSNDPLTEIDEIVSAIKSDNLVVDGKTAPFIKAGKQRIEGAAETLKALFKEDARADPTETVKALGETKDARKKLKLSSQLGVEILYGAPRELTYGIQDEEGRNFLYGAKTVKNLMNLNNMKMDSFPI